MGIRDGDLIQIVNDLRDGFADLKANVVSRWGRIPNVAADPTSPPDGAVWIRSDDLGLRWRSNGATKVSPLGEVAYAEATGVQAAFGPAITDITNATVTFTAVAGRKYEIAAFAAIQQNTAAGIPQLNLTDGAGTLLAASPQSELAAGVGSMFILKRVVPGAGSVTYKLRASSTAGTITMSQGATFPTVIRVHDVGAS